MKISCPHCGKEFLLSGLGRKKINVSVKNIYDKLATGESIPTVAQELGCSRAYIYNLLNKQKIKFSKGILVK